MADVITSDIVRIGRNDFTNELREKIIVHITNISDGSGESAAIKVDRSTLSGGTIKKLNLRDIRWNMQGLSSVRLYWDHTIDNTIMILSGNGYEYFDHLLIDPNTSGDVVSANIGDVILTTNGAIAGSVYDITMTFIPQY